MSVMFKQGIILAYDFDVQARQDCTPDQEAADCGDTLLTASQIRQLKARASDEAERRYSYRFKVKRMCLKVKSCCH